MIAWIIGAYVGFSVLMVWSLCRIAARADAALDRERHERHAMSDHNRRQHAGWATAANRRGEQLLACAACGWTVTA